MHRDYESVLRDVLASSGCVRAVRPGGRCGRPGRTRACSYAPTTTSTRTSGVATATLPYSGHLPLKRSMRCAPCSSVTPCRRNDSRTELNTLTSVRTGLRRIDLPCNRDARGLERHLLGSSDHLYELDPARRDPGEEELGRGDRLSRASVVDGTVGDEVLIAAAPEHSPERVRGTSANCVPPRLGDTHAARHPLSESSVVRPRAILSRRRSQPQVRVSLPLWERPPPARLFSCLIDQQELVRSRWQPRCRSGWRPAHFGPVWCDSGKQLAGWTSCSAAKDGRDPLARGPVVKERSRLGEDQEPELLGTRR